MITLKHSLEIITGNLHTKEGNIAIMMDRSSEMGIIEMVYHREREREINKTFTPYVLTALGLCLSTIQGQDFYDTILHEFRDSVIIRGPLELPSG